MNAPPFGLPPIVFSIIMVVSWLTLGPLVVWLFMRKFRHYRAMPFQQPDTTPPVYPSLTLPTRPYADIVGVWHFKSATRWIGVACGAFVALAADRTSLEVAAPILAAGLLVIVYSFWRPSRAAQRCTVDPNLYVTFGRGDREIPLDLNHYRYVRMHVGASRYGSTLPSMTVFDRDSRAGLGTLLSSTVFPRFDDARIVLFHNRWRTADGALIPPSLADDFFRDACRRAGYEPVHTKTLVSAGHNGPWEVRPL
jgi:hypothetical protein